MPILWPATEVAYDQPGEPVAGQIRSAIDVFATHVKLGLDALGVSRYDTLLWQPWHLAVLWDSQALWCAFTPNTGGTSEVRYFDKSAATYDETLLRDRIGEGLGWTELEVIRLPLPGASNADARIEAAATAYVENAERNMRLHRLGDLAELQHLKPQLEEFLNDHPDPARNVFLMMSFSTSEHHGQIHAAITDVLAKRNLKALRADDREYSDDLWSNIEVYLTGCRYGIAVFEDISKREFNPNVSLELGYMMGRRKRCLLLKEQHLPTLPTDVVGKLYKTFDAFHIEETVTAAVTRWIDVDLRLPH